MQKSAHTFVDKYYRSQTERHRIAHKAKKDENFRVLRPWRRCFAMKTKIFRRKKKHKWKEMRMRMKNVELKGGRAIVYVRNPTHTRVQQPWRLHQLMKYFRVIFLHINWLFMEIRLFGMALEPTTRDFSAVLRDACLFRGREWGNWQQRMCNVGWLKTFVDCGKCAGCKSGENWSQTWNLAQLDLMTKFAKQLAVHYQLLIHS